MTAVVFLAIAVVISVIGGLIVWVRHREPTTWDSGIRDFAREMEALRPGEARIEPRRVVHPPDVSSLADDEQQLEDH